MSYADIADLAADPEFRRRLGAGLAQESATKVPGDDLAELVMRNPELGVIAFVPFVSVAPGFADAYAAGGIEAITDPMLLSAMQASWSKVASIYPAPAP